MNWFCRVRLIQILKNFLSIHADVDVRFQDSGLSFIYSLFRIRQQHKNDKTIKEIRPIMDGYQQLGTTKLLISWYQPMTECIRGFQKSQIS